MVWKKAIIIFLFLFLFLFFIAIYRWYFWVFWVQYYSNIEVGDTTLVMKISNDTSKSICEPEFTFFYW